MEKKWFFGWSNIKWLIKELIKLYSVEISYFSKKRVESGVAFLVGQFGMIYFLMVNINKLDSTDIAIWASIEFAISGYIVSQIQKEKKIHNTIL
jgi:hypothetical protein